MRSVHVIRLPNSERLIRVVGILSVEATRVSESLAAGATLTISYTTQAGSLLGEYRPEGGGIFYPVMRFGFEEDDGLGGTTADCYCTLTIGGQDVMLISDSDLSSQQFRSFGGGIRWNERRIIPLSSYPEGVAIEMVITNGHGSAARRVWGAYSFDMAFPEDTADFTAALTEVIRGTR